MQNLVAIVGRPNVGKSTFFNRLTKSRQAIVAEESGTTRDRQYGRSEWNGIEFSVVDTGGWVENSEDIFEEEINKQVMLAIEEADIILFLVDVNTGLTDLDMAAAKILRQYKNKRNILLVSNKTDTFVKTYDAVEFYSLGLGDPISISASNGLGTGDLMDKLYQCFNKDKKEVEYEDIPKVAIVGRPNAGKSSLVNALIDEDRNIVTDIAGTTRDSINTRYSKFGFDFYLIDTAGIRKKGKVNEDLEYYSVIRSIKSIEGADVCILMLDATRGIESQDMNIFSIIQKNKKGLVVCVNKWDLVEEKSKEAVSAMKNAIFNRFAPFTDFPVIFTSAITKMHIYKALESVKKIYDIRKQHISTNKLNEYLLPLIESFPPPATKGKYIKIKYITQLKGPVTPTFIFFANLPQYIKAPYKRFLENKIRQKWDFCGTPIQLFMRRK